MTFSERFAHDCIDRAWQLVCEEPTRLSTLFMDRKLDMHLPHRPCVCLYLMTSGAIYGVCVGYQKRLDEEGEEE